MDINSLEPNSHKYRREKAMEAAPPEKKRFEKVISGTATVHKKSLIKRFFEIFFSGDVKDVKSYLLFDVIFPSMKETLCNLVNKGTEMLIYGESSRPVSKKPGGTTYVSYSSSYRQPEREKLAPSRQNRMSHRFDDICFETRGDAEQVVDILVEAVSIYGQVTVGDLYDAAGITPDWTDDVENYGWTDLAGIGIVRIRNGYILDLPKCVRLN